MSGPRLLALAVWLVVFLMVWLVEKQPVWVAALVGLWWVFCGYMFLMGTVWSHDD